MIVTALVLYVEMPIIASVSGRLVLTIGQTRMRAMVEADGAEDLHHRVPAKEAANRLEGSQMVVRQR